MGKRKNKNPVLNLQPTTSATGEKSEVMSQYQSPTTTSAAGEKSEIMSQHQSPNPDSTKDADATPNNPNQVTVAGEKSEIMSQHQSPNPDSTKDADVTPNNPNQVTGGDKGVEDAVIINHGRDQFSAGDEAILKAIQNLANQVGNQRNLSLFKSIIEGVKAVAFLAGCAALTWAAFSAKKSSNSFNQACQKWGKKDGPALFEALYQSPYPLPAFKNLTNLHLKFNGACRIYWLKILPRLLENTPYLEVLVLDKMFWNNSEEDEEFQCLLPVAIPVSFIERLREMEIKAFMMLEDNCPFIEYFLHNGKALRKMTLGAVILPSDYNTNASFNKCSEDCQIVFQHVYYWPPSEPDCD